MPPEVTEAPAPDAKPVTVAVQPIPRGVLPLGGSVTDASQIAALAHAAPVTGEVRDANAPAATPEAAPLAADAAPPPRRNVHTLTDSQFSKLKREAGDAEARRIAKRAGFESPAEMEAFLAKARADAAAAAANETQKPTPAKPAAKPTEPKPTTKAEGAPAGEGDEPRAIPMQSPDAERANQLRIERARLEKANRLLRRDLAAREGEFELHKAALRAGILREEDSDYAMHLLKRHLGGLDEAGADAFDPDAFFAGLKKSNPYLFGVQQVAGSNTPGSAPGVTTPATLAAAQAARAGAPPAPTKEHTQEASATKRFDAMNATEEEFQTYARSKGWRLPHSGTSYPTASPPGGQSRG